jgi:hypothetical protein
MRKGATEMEEVKSLPEKTIKIQTKKSRRKGILLVVAVLLLIIIVSISFLYGNPLRTILSFTKVGDEPLYTMTYYGDYGFDEFLKTGRYPNFHLLKTAAWRNFQNQKSPHWACSVFSARNEKGNPILGRNFDWSHRSAVLLFTNPPNGYRSVSLLDPCYCGYNPPNYIPASVFDRTKLLTMPWMPLDGMNECGLAVGTMAVPHAESSHDPNKMTISGWDAFRLVLDHAKNVAEAIMLIKKYNISFPLPSHCLIADASGHSAVIEFVDGKMEVIQTEQPWQVATNFQLYNTKDISSLLSPGAIDHIGVDRYSTAFETLKKTNGIISDNNAMKLLKDISQTTTMWSVVYNLSTGDIQVRTGYDPTRISQVKKFKLKMKN